MKKTLSLFLCLIMIFIGVPQTFAASESALTETAVYLQQVVTEPKVGSVGGEWAVLGLARSGVRVSDGYFENYYQAVENYVRDCGGKLHDKKYTEYSRLIVALRAIGKNPTDVAGYNLLTPLGDYENTIWQGVNGAVWALIALDSGDYEIPFNPDAVTQATRERYLRHILECQKADGGWALSGDHADVDVTAMALQALSRYRDNGDVQAAIDRALVCLSEMQDENGGFSILGTPTAESCAQVVTALCALGISPQDARFVKNGSGVADYMLTYRANNGGFRHVADGEVNQMATEQCFYALVALQRYLDGKPALYHITDPLSLSASAVGLSGKHSDVNPPAATARSKTFADIAGNEYQTAIEALAARNIINGKTDSIFEPNSTMTRAEFAAVVVRALGLPEKSNDSFADVTSSDWFYRYIGTASAYGIVNGVSATEFAPNGTITREEAAVMTVRAAKLCGMDTAVSADTARDTLAAFEDYIKISDWAFDCLAFCYAENLLSSDAMEIRPKDAVLRAEIADMLYRMMSRSGLTEGV